VTYEWREHTAEVELAIDAATRDEVFRDAVGAFGRLIELGDDGEPASFEATLDGADDAARLVSLLEELIYLADTESFVPDEARVDGDRVALRGRRTQLQPIVKAATWHGLTFEPRGDRWYATVVLDV
jgi:SHS2 domain-containing protein